MIWNVSGLSGSGKTTFGLTGPQTVAVLVLDNQFELAYRNYKQRYPDRQVIYQSYTSKLAKALNDKSWNVKDVYTDVWNSSMEVLEKWLNDTTVRSVVIDQGTTLWEVQRYAEFGMERRKPSDYEICNAAMKHILYRFQTRDKLLVILHRMKDEWGMVPNASGRPTLGTTGNKIRDGFKHYSYDLDSELAVGIRMMDCVDGEGNATGRRYLQRYLWFPPAEEGGMPKCNPNQQLMVDMPEIANIHDPATGKLTMEMVTLPMVASMIYRTGVEEWQ